MKKLLPDRTGLVGERIRQARGSTPQMDFAQALGVGQSTLSGIEKGRQSPTMKLIADVAAITGCDLNWLILGTGSAPAGYPTARAGSQGGPSAAEIWRDPEEAGTDPDLYRAWIPIIGCYTPDGVVDMPERGENEQLEPYLAFGPVPAKSVAVRLLAVVAGFPSDTHLVFGPVDGHAGEAGFGLFLIKGNPRHLIAAWSRRGDKFTIFSAETTAQTLPRAVIMEYRSFVAFVP